MRLGHIEVDADFTDFYRKSDLLTSPGGYFQHLSRYIRIFPREGMLTLIFEEAVRDPHRAISDCYQFLGVDNRFSPSSLETKIDIGRDARILHNQVWEI